MKFMCVVHLPGNVRKTFERTGSDSISITRQISSAYPKAVFISVSDFFRVDKPMSLYRLLKPVS